MARWLNRLLRREETIGDIIAQSIEHSPQDWEIERIGPFLWKHRNGERGWTVLLHADCSRARASFDGCSLQVRKALALMHGRRSRGTERRSNSPR